MSEQAEYYPIDPSTIQLPAAASIEELAARRNRVFRELLRRAPLAARPELEEALTPPTVNLLFGINIPGLAPLIAEIYAIDQALTPSTNHQ